MSSQPVFGSHALQGDLSCKPSLVPHLRVQEQLIRNRRWAIVQNTVSGDFLRVDARLWTALLQLQGHCSLREWLAAQAERFDTVSLLHSVVQLQRHGLLGGMSTAAPVAAPAVKKWVNPLMLKFPLFNPSRLLDRLARYSEVVAGRTVLWLIFALFVLAIVLALLNISELRVTWQRVLSAPEQWWQYLLLYPSLKCLHELAHGLVLRRLGGDVREAGLSLLVLMPMPYVNATGVWLLSGRRDRLAVTAAGMLSDVLWASLAMTLWSSLQSGVLADMAFAVMVMGMVSVAVFNANPLLKFDGYYLLEDVLDSPGLARRSQAYWQYLFKRYLFCAKGVVRPLLAEGERRWLLPYGLASLIYRLVISIVISVFLISQFHELGFLLAAFSIVPMFIRPLSRLLVFLANSEQLKDQRRLAIARLLLLSLLVILPITLLPLPSSTRAEGIIWSPAQTEIFAPEEGDAGQWQIENGESVVAGQLLIQLQAPALSVEKRRQESQLALLLLEHGALQNGQPEVALKKRVEIEQRREILAGLQRRINSLTVRAPRDGRVAFSEKALLSGQRVLQGELLLYLVGEESVVVRTVVEQRQLGKLQAGVTRASVRMVDDISTVLPATLARQIPSGNNSLPSMALANNGFGGIDVQLGGDSMETVEEVFHLELTLDESLSAQAHGGLGGRAYITLQHPAETLGKRWWRSSRQLFLQYLGA